jgi:hypothetical protein
MQGFSGSRRSQGAVAPEVMEAKAVRRESVGECYVHGAMEGEMMEAAMQPENASRRVAVVLV